MDALVISGVTADDNARSWKITDVQLKADILQIDSSVDNEYTKHVLAGEHVPITLSSYHSQYSATPNSRADTFSTNINRSLTRIKALFVTFVSNAELTDSRKIPNTVHHPMVTTLSSGDIVYDPAKEIQFQLQIGSKVFPVYEIKSVPDYFFIKKAAGIHYSTFHNVDLSPLEYYTYKFIIAYDLEKIIDRAYSGINTKAGDSITLHRKTATSINGVYILLHYDSLVKIRDNSIEYFD